MILNNNEVFSINPECLYIHKEDDFNVSLDFRNMLRTITALKDYVVKHSILNKEDFLIFEKCINNAIYESIGINNLHIEQCNTYSPLERRIGEKLVAISYMGLVDITTILIKQEDKTKEEFGWFNINCLPKIGYDHKKIIDNAIDHLRSKFINFEVLKILFPSDFTLSEIQKSFEQILNKKFDRRNFRKKFMQLNLISETGEKTEGSNGRPAKLYQFNNEDIVRDLF
jgi:8-oxo-dGTP diphosphatase